MKRKPQALPAFKTPPIVDAVLREAFSQPPKFVKPKEYIYLTKSDFGYKIGRTTQPENRPLAVAGNMPIKLTVITVIEVPDSIAAEKRIHSFFEKKWLRGEWFDLNDQDVEMIKGYPATFDDLPPGDDVPF